MLARARFSSRNECLKARSECAPWEMPDPFWYDHKLLENIFLPKFCCFTEAILREQHSHPQMWYLHNGTFILLDRYMFMCFTLWAYQKLIYCKLVIIIFRSCGGCLICYVRVCHQTTIFRSFHTEALWNICTPTLCLYFGQNLIQSYIR